MFQKAYIIVESIVTMAAKLGFIVSLISGIIIILSGILFMAFPITQAQSDLLKYYAGQNIPATSNTIPYGVFFIGAVILYGASQIRKDGFEVKNGKMVLLFSFISLFIAGIGSIVNIIGSILGILGGILAILKK